MAEYEKIGWQDYVVGSTGNTPINAENLNKMDNGIYTSFKKDIGFIAFYCKSTPPDGWLVCRGQSLSKATYNELWKVIGYSFGGSGSTFNLPDLRGEFIRGYNCTDDDTGNKRSAGIDANRDFGSKQSATRFSVDSTGSRYVDNGENEQDVQIQTTGSFTRETKPSISVRPNNIALLPCIFTGVFTTDLS